MIKPRIITVYGHLNAATCERLQHVLRRHGINVEVEVIPSSTSEPFGLDEVTISLAGAIAAIVACVVNMWQLRAQLRDLKREEQEKSIDYALREIGDGTYERVSGISIPDNVVLRDAHEFSVTLRDVPAARLIIVTVRNWTEIVVIDSSELPRAKGR